MRDAAREQLEGTKKKFKEVDTEVNHHLHLHLDLVGWDEMTKPGLYQYNSATASLILHFSLLFV